MKLTFYGAAGTVTGSKHLIETDKGTRILLDCGMYQGESSAKNKNQDFAFDAEKIDFVFLSHAHIDHSGLLPLLVKNDFKGPIYVTASTYDLCEIMLSDSAFIQQNDLTYINKIRLQKDLKPLEPLYSIEDVEKTLGLMKIIEEDEVLHLNNEFFVKAIPNGHILGSVAFHFTFKHNNKQTSLAFTGDIGREKDSILRNPTPLPHADYIICESTYGDRVHPPFADTESILLKLVHETCVEKKGKIIIPAFSVDRTQELIYAIDRLEHFGKLPPINVYVDSPLSIKATKIMAAHKNEFNPEMLDYICKDGDPFGFKNLFYVQSVEESKKINESDEPCIIISASGMAEAGRIKHHLKNNIENPKNLILLVGYATPGSLAGRLKNKETPVRIFGDWFDVKAQVKTLEYFSAHGDFLEMIGYLKEVEKSMVKNIFLVHGHDNSRKSFELRLKAADFPKVTLPYEEDTYELD